MKKQILFFLLISITWGCQNQLLDSETDQVEPIHNFDYATQSILWQQNSAEYKALCYQAYNIAKLKLSINPLLTSGKKLAIISDLDETVLDNTPYFVYRLQNQRDFNLKDWKLWTDKIEAQAIPGAVSFFQYAASLGVEVFYVSNRFDWQKKETIKNLQLHNLPFADEEHVLLHTKTRDKTERMNKVREDHEVLLYLGDDLGDFSSKFSKNSNHERSDITDTEAQNFGNKYIIFPNPTFGSWESKGIFQGKSYSSNEKREEIRKQNLIAY